MRSYIIFSGTGPILILTTYSALTDPRLVDKLRHKGILKFIAYEVPIEVVQRIYGVPFDVISADLERIEDVRVLDFNGHHIFSSISFSDFGEPIKVGGKE